MLHPVLNGSCGLFGTTLGILWGAMPGLTITVTMALMILLLYIFYDGIYRRRS